MHESGRWNVRLGRSVAAIAVAVGLVSLPVQFIFGNLPFELRPDLGTAAGAFAIAAVGFGVVAWLTLPTERENLLVWLLTVSALFAAMAAFGTVLVSLSWPTELTAEDVIDPVSPAQLPTVGAVGVLIINAAWVPGILLVLTVGLLLFPDGRPAAGWDWLVRFNGLVVALLVVFNGLASHPNSTEPIARSLLDYFDGGLLALIAGLLYLPLIVGGVLAVAVLAGSYRESTGTRRHQIQWIAFGGAAVFAGGLFRGLDIVGPALAGMVVFLACFYVAITKYRLYDIDVVVNRSLQFGALAVFIGGVYVGIVVGVGELLGTESGFGLSIVASVLVAMAFQPARRRVERWANRLVYGERATPYEVLVRFSRRSAELSDEELLDRIPQMIVDGTGSETATLWTRTENGFRTGSMWPADRAGRRIEGIDGFEDPDADHSVPVFHDGELLGGLSLVKVRGETMTPAEEELLADLASGLGLALRNARLTGELRRQVAELEASRERVLAASDEARRALENDLDSGPQQQLVALKVKLGPTRKLAERAGAEKTAALLEQLEIEAGAAIQAVRDFAGGIYPPLLEAEGLAVAINQQTRSAAIPIDITDEGIGRYGRDVEAAIYFSVLEALQNTAKYAGATSASVLLRDEAGSLHFEVHDDGSGFDAATVTRGAGLTGMADRLDTVGGSVNIDSSPGGGTVVTGSVPIPELVHA